MMRDECGVFGVYGHPEAANLTYLGLYALQHRGQEGAGIVCANANGDLKGHRGKGLVSKVFKPHELNALEGPLAVGHVRYSTHGSNSIRNVQPLMTDYKHGSMALGHNGNLVNATFLRERLEDEGHLFQTTSDTEVFLHLVACSKEERFADSIIDTLQHVEGAYSLVATNGEEVVAARDPLGFRPLWLGRLGGAFIFASETCALDIIDAEWEREVEPGEVLVASERGLESFKPFETVTPKPCIFEFIYVARPDSQIFGRSVDQVRKRMGACLARQEPVEADVVMSVPDSSNQVALGYAHESGIPFDFGLIRSHYVGRTFIEPEQKIRDFGVKVKFNAVRSAIKGKRVVLIDDSIVRGTTSQKIVKLFRHCGVKELHFRVSSPPVTGACFYGIDTPEKSKLIAANNTVEEIREYLTVDSLVYLSVENVLEAVGAGPDEHCMACFTGNYPTRLPHEFVTRENVRRHVDTSLELLI
jgi:amidophosphoribosyltransferase